MNTKRELFLLFPYSVEIPKGYVAIHKKSFPNDEPPYIMCSFWGITTSYDLTRSIFEEDEESIHFYLIRIKDARKFVNWMNQTERDYLDDYYQLQVERSYDDKSVPQLSNGQIQEIVSKERSERRPKVKYMSVAPVVNLT